VVASTAPGFWSAVTALMLSEMLLAEPTYVLSKTFLTWTSCGPQVVGLSALRRRWRPENALAYGGGGAAPGVFGSHEHITAASTGRHANMYSRSHCRGSSGASVRGRLTPDGAYKGNKHVPSGILAHSCGRVYPPAHEVSGPGVLHGAPDFGKAQPKVFR
jgi:hypothetical protein